MKNYFTICLTIVFLSLAVSAQEELLTNNETEVVLMILEKESNWPMCRLSDQVRINSEFVPKNRVGNVDTTSIEDIRICQEEDVWNAVKEEMVIGMAVGGPSLGFSSIAKVIYTRRIGLYYGVYS